MIRQCAWCLRLMDEEGERASRQPLPKLYEATHGMCCICAMLWMEQVAKDQGLEVVRLWDKNVEARMSTPGAPLHLTVGLTAVRPVEVQ